MRKIIFIRDFTNDVSICITGEGGIVLQVVGFDQGLRKRKNRESNMMNKFTDDFIKSTVLDRLTQTSVMDLGKGSLFGPTNRIRPDFFTSVSWFTDDVETGNSSEIDDFFGETDDDIPW